jgi:hypothetical protein
MTRKSVHSEDLIIAITLQGGIVTGITSNQQMEATVIVIDYDGEEGEEDYGEFDIQSSEELIMGSISMTEINFPPDFSLEELQDAVIRRDKEAEDVDGLDSEEEDDDD